MTPRDRLPETRLDETVDDIPVRSTWSDTPSTEVVKAVATATGIDPLELPPLHDYVATEALDSLLAAPSTTSGHTARVSFSYAGLEITVYGDGGIEIGSE